MEIKKTEPIRVLQIVSEMGRGGIETMVMNIYRNIDRSKVQFDFLAHYGREAAYNNEIRKMGGRIYEMPALRDDSHIYYWKLFSYIRALNMFFKEHHYSIIHCNMTNTAVFYMPIAKKNGVKCIISHSHNSHAKKGLPGLLTNLLQRNIYKYATDYFACSEAAEHWFYPKELINSGKIVVIPNAIDARSFSYNVDKRNNMRKQLKINDGEIIIGSVGRFRPEKNQIFILKLLKAILNEGVEAKVVFVGNGECEDQVKKSAKEENLENYTLFLGARSDVPELMQAMDVFLLPSLWEGLPLVGIEAQASGLPCIVSDTVTRELSITDLVEYLSLKDSISVWIQHIISASRGVRYNMYGKIKDAGYDIKTTAAWFQKFYLDNAK